MSCLQFPETMPISKALCPARSMHAGKKKISSPSQGKHLFTEEKGDEDICSENHVDQECLTRMVLSAAGTKPKTLSGLSQL